jgi:hypothetical protein
MSTGRLVRIGPGDDERAALTRGFQGRLTPLDIANGLPLGHEQAQALSPGPHGPAIFRRLDEEACCYCGLDHNHNLARPAPASDHWFCAPMAAIRRFGRQAGETSQAPRSFYGR